MRLLTFASDAGSRFGVELPNGILDVAVSARGRVGIEKIGALENLVVSAQA